MPNVDDDTVLHQPVRRVMLRTAALSVASVALAGCIVVPRPPRLPHHGGYASHDGDGEVVYQAPPAPHHESTYGAPGPGYVWIGGYWAWTGGSYAWRPGRWIVGRPGHRWVPHAWHRHGRGWRHAPGYWSRG